MTAAEKIAQLAEWAGHVDRFVSAMHKASPYTDLHQGFSERKEQRRTHRALLCALFGPMRSEILASPETGRTAFHKTSRWCGEIVAFLHCEAPPYPHGGELSRFPSLVADTLPAYPGDLYPHLYGFVSTPPDAAHVAGEFRLGFTPAEGGSQDLPLQLWLHLRPHSAAPQTVAHGEDGVLVVSNPLSLMPTRGVDERLRELWQAVHCAVTGAWTLVEDLSHNHRTDPNHPDKEP